MTSNANFPEPLRGRDKDFTFDSIAVRLPKIWDEMIKNNNFTEQEIEKLHIMMDEMRNGKKITQIEGLDEYIQKLARENKKDSPEYEEATEWRSRLEDPISRGSTWWDAPWLFVEIYAYRRALQILNYFENLKDPFEPSKNKSLQTSWDKIEKFCSSSAKDDSIFSPSSLIKFSASQFQILIYNSLWGNKADLSRHPQGNENEEQIQNIENNEKLLINHIEKITKKVENFSKNGGVDEIHVILDNAGLELFSDLVFCDGLIRLGITKKVVLHCKAHPVFVSDALEKDVHYTIKEFKNYKNEYVSKFGERWESYLKGGKWSLTHSYFWNNPVPFWNLPPTLHSQISKSSLTFLKGDANYRRIHGDLHWKSNFKTEKVGNIKEKFPSSFVMLRMNKSGVFSDLSEEAFLRIKDEKNWCTSGEYGLIQMIEKDE